MSNEKVIVAKYSMESVFRIPKHINLEDKDTYDYWIKWNTLYIQHKPTDKIIYQLEPVWGDDHDAMKYPHSEEVQHAGEYDLEEEEYITWPDEDSPHFPPTTDFSNPHDGMVVKDVDGKDWTWCVEDGWLPGTDHNEEEEEVEG
jgi:hypothetical protein